MVGEDYKIHVGMDLISLFYFPLFLCLIILRLPYFSILEIPMLHLVQIQYVVND